MNAFFSRVRCRPFQITILTVMFIFFVCTTPAHPQARAALTANEINELLKSGVSANRLVQLVESHGVAFELDDQTLRRLKENGATSEVLSSVKKMSVRFAEEKQRMRQEQEEVAKRLREEEAKRRDKAKLQAEQEQRRLAELERKKAEEAKQRAEEVRQREQGEARRREEEKRRADEQKRQQDEAEMARLAEERRRQEETRLAEEKRRAEQAARAAEAERKKSEELIAKNKIEEEKRRATMRSLMALDQMKSGYTSAPTYSDGDFWYFNSIDDFSSYDGRRLQGVYELRYSGEQFQVRKDKQPINSQEANPGFLLAMVGRGRYQGGQYLKFPLNTGQKWSQQYESGARASRVILTWNSETAVKGVENITTQAGKFAVFKVVREAQSHQGHKATVHVLLQSRDQKYH